MSLFTQLIVIYFHGAIVPSAINDDDRDFSYGHLTHLLQILISLLSVHAIVFTGSSDDLEKERIISHNCQAWT